MWKGDCLVVCRQQGNRCNRRVYEVIGLSIVFGDWKGRPIHFHQCIISLWLLSDIELWIHTIAMILVPPEYVLLKEWLGTTDSSAGFDFSLSSGEIWAPLLAVQIWGHRPLGSTKWPCVSFQEPCAHMRRNVLYPLVSCTRVVDTAMRLQRRKTIQQAQPNKSRHHKLHPQRRFHWRLNHMDQWHRIRTTPKRLCLRCNMLTIVIFLSDWYLSNYSQRCRRTSCVSWWRCKAI